MSLNDGQRHCTHGYLVVLREQEGWWVPYPSEQCPACSPNEPCGLPFKDGDGSTPPPVVDEAPRLVECPEPGCCLIIEEGVPHTAPCLDPDATAKEKESNGGYAVEVNYSAKWHAPIHGWTPRNRVGTAHTRCGLFGKVTDRTISEAVNCKTCLKARDA